MVASHTNPDSIPNCNRLRFRLRNAIEIGPVKIVVRNRNAPSNCAVSSYHYAFSSNDLVEPCCK